MSLSFEGDSKMIVENISDADLRKRALLLLNENLGAANTVRFLSMHNTGKLNYMQIRDEWSKFGYQRWSIFSCHSEKDSGLSSLHCQVPFFG